MLRIALINGCDQAAGQYVQAVRRLRGVSLTACLQPDAGKRQRIASLLHVIAAAATWNELLSAHGAEFDAVLIRGSVRDRPDLACQAAAAGKHVFLSSPAACSAAELQRMTAACATAGVTLMVGSRRRFEPPVVAVKAALDSGKLGAPSLVRLHQWLPVDMRQPDAIRFDVAQPGGRRWAEVVTQLDLATWCFGRQPQDILAQGVSSSDFRETTPGVDSGTPPHPAPLPRDESQGTKRTQGGILREWPEYLQVHLGFSDGGMALISLAFTLPAGQSYGTLSVIGTTGAAYADEQHQVQLKLAGTVPAAVRDSDDVPTKVAQLRAFVRSVTEPQLAEASVRDMSAALKLAEAVSNSLVSGEPIRLPGADS